MKPFIGTKMILARPMGRGEYNIYRGWQIPLDENPADEGFLVEYVDGGASNHPDHAGYISWSPKDVFERAYRPSSGLGFGDALQALKAGKRVARAGWNGKGMFVYYVRAAAYLAQSEVAKAYFGENAYVPYAPYLALKGVDEKVSTWVPSINDVLAEDWFVIEAANA